MIRLVLFDIDGTLIASGGAGVRAFAAAAEHAFALPGATRQMTFAGRTDVSLVRELFLSQGIEPSAQNITLFLTTYLHWLERYLHELPGRVLPGVSEALATIRALPEPPVISLLTGNVRRGAELKLRRYGLWEEFVLGAFADDHEDRNQIAAIAHQRGAEHLGRPLAGSEILVIGDTPHDITCARHIGAPCLAVATGGFTVDQLRAHDPAWAVENLHQIDLPTVCRG
ncbi:MAG: haloacid dehalogenase-like hydrolase [Verrucomicrobiales bacterium]|nr:haloacid dehalogenase-like hydrolase [Verrucomicrobiales bacterium]